MTDKNTAFRPIGVSGLSHWGGRINEEYLTELQGDRWRRVVREMITNDPMIGGILFAIEMLIRQVDWSVAPASTDDADGEVARFVDGCLHDMREAWSLTLAEMLSLLPWGWAPMELTYKLRSGEKAADPLRSSQYDDGRVGWASWSIRAQDTLVQWEFNDAGDPIGFVQQAPPDYRAVFIPLAKCLHLKTSARKGNPEGVSVLRACYRPWYFKKHIENIEAIGIERDLAGLPVAEVPANLLGVSRTADETAVFNAIREIVVNIRRDEQEGVIWPMAYDDSGKPLYNLKLLSSGGTRQFDTGKIIDRYNTQIAMAVLADFMMLGHQATGSWALASSKTSLFSTALGAWLDTICQAVNTQAIPQLLRMNGMDASRAPKLTHGDVESLELGELGAFVQALGTAAPLFTGDAGQQLYAHLLKQAGLPVPSEEGTEEAPDDAAASPTANTIASGDKPILGYHIETGVVSRNEARAQLGLPPEQDNGDQVRRNLMSQLSLVKAAVDAAIPLDVALQLAGLELNIPATKPAEPTAQTAAEPVDDIDALIEGVLDEAFALAGEAAS